ncbi:hypothetical protein BDQ17DRAFT_1421426 [Cyathus striatus]|nr:hypothetical protein BDQ17DRAFT_1421426 [Cyathus striatus]
MSTAHDDNRLQSIKDDSQREREESSNTPSDALPIKGESLTTEIAKSNSDKILVEAKALTVIESKGSVPVDDSKNTTEDTNSFEKLVKNALEEGLDEEWNEDEDEEFDEEPEDEELDEEDLNHRGWPKPQAKPFKPVFGGNSKPNRPK